MAYEDALVESLKDGNEAAAYLEAAIEDGDQAVLMLALRRVAQARGGVAEIARRAKLTREATYKMLSKVGNPANPLPGTILPRARPSRRTRSKPAA